MELGILLRVSDNQAAQLIQPGLLEAAGSLPAPG
jgi:hypothetical protein